MTDHQLKAYREKLEAQFKAGEITLAEFGSKWAQLEKARDESREAASPLKIEISRPGERTVGGQLKFYGGASRVRAFRPITLKAEAVVAMALDRQGFLSRALEVIRAEVEGKNTQEKRKTTKKKDGSTESYTVPTLGDLEIHNVEAFIADLFEALEDRGMPVDGLVVNGKAAKAKSQ